LDQRSVDLADSPTKIGADGAPIMDMQGRTYSWGPWGWRSDRWRIRKLGQMVKEYGREPALRAFVVNRVLRPAGVPPEDYRGQAAALLKWVQTNIYYVNEPDELLQSPWWTMRLRNGDCDDMAILLASMAHSIAIPWRLVLGGSSREGRTRWAPGHGPKPPGFTASHLYVDLGWPPFDPQVWAAAEPTRNVALGTDLMIQAGPVEGRSDLGGVRGWGGTIVGRRVFTRRNSYGQADQAAEPTSLTDQLETAPLLERATTWIKTALKPDDIATGVISGVIQGLIIAVIMERFRRRKNGRKARS
jgi:transglutaminase-like putative cysteine protease